MTPPRDPQKTLFFKQQVLPVLFIFLIPGFAAWFFPYAERKTDVSVVSEVTADVRSDPQIADDRKERIIDFYEHYPPSRIMASSDPRDVKLQGMFSSLKTDYATFKWMARLAWICLGTIALTFMIVGLSVAYSFRGHAAQYLALRIGWPVLRTSAAVQVLGQGILAVALSYWVTALWMHQYVPKLIGMIAILAGIGVIALWKAIFSKVDDRCLVAGETVSETAAPRLWQRVRDMATGLGTAAPDRIIVGIDPSFFVTEHPVTLAGETYQGRTLYLSLPMLKVMAVEEADAVLGHELAHFSGDDTFWSRRISPLTGKFAIYTQKLLEGSAIVAQFMLLFWKLYGLSIRKLSREREFRADGIGADVTTKEAMKRALVKITCYCEYRDKTESGVLEKQRVDTDLNLAGQLESGYPAFLSSFAQNERSEEERVPHPFDTHPTLHNRLAHLGFEAQAALRDADIQRPVENSWYEAIQTAPDLESRMWADRQELLQAIHREELAWRFLPADAEETAQVLQYFPPAVFRDKKGKEATLAFDRLQLPDWEAPIFFKDIAKVEVVDSYGRKTMTVRHQQAGQPKPAKIKCQPAVFKNEAGDLLAAFGKYYNRHKTAEEFAKRPQAVVSSEKS